MVSLGWKLFENDNKEYKLVAPNGTDELLLSPFEETPSYKDFIDNLFLRDQFFIYGFEHVFAQWDFFHTIEWGIHAIFRAGGPCVSQTEKYVHTPIVDYNDLI